MAGGLLTHWLRCASLCMFISISIQAASTHYLVHKIFLKYSMRMCVWYDVNIRSYYVLRCWDGGGGEEVGRRVACGGGTERFHSLCIITI